MEDKQPRPTVLKNAKIVVRKRRKQPTKHGASVRPSRGLPSLSRPPLLTEPPSQEEKVDEFASSFSEQDLPSETLMVIRSLQQQPSHSLVLPLSDGDMIQAVLECQVLTRLTQQSAMKELQQMMDSQDIIQLRAAENVEMNRDGLAVLLPRVDFIRGVQDAAIRRQRLRSHAESPLSCTAVIDWFLKHFNQWTGRMINIHPSLLPKYKIEDRSYPWE